MTRPVSHLYSASAFRQILWLTGALLVQPVDAADQGHGMVHMDGKILDSACSVDTNSRDQTIDMLTQPASEIISAGEGLPRPFSIRLVNCNLSRAQTSAAMLPDWQYFRVTFDGIHDGKSFGVTGEARGIALQIRDARDVVAIPGEPMPASNITPDDMTMDYTLRLVGNGKDMQAGDYRTTIRYKLDYY
jgi:type 1 fimbria pilin